MASLEALDQFLKHLIDVESEMIDLSNRSHQNIAAWIENAKLEASEEVLQAMQYQDILSQQLGATIEAIGSIREFLSKNVDSRTEEDLKAVSEIEQMDAKLIDVLEKAQEKRAAFSGKSGVSDDEIEFF